jgi:hypothetical protein
MCEEGQQQCGQGWIGTARQNGEREVKKRAGWCGRRSSCLFAWAGSGNHASGKGKNCGWAQTRGLQADGVGVASTHPQKPSDNNGLVKGSKPVRKRRET